MFYFERRKEPIWCQILFLKKKMFVLYFLVQWIQHLSLYTFLSIHSNTLNVWNFKKTDMCNRKILTCSRLRFEILIISFIASKNHIAILHFKCLLFLVRSLDCPNIYYKRTLLRIPAFFIFFYSCYLFAKLQQVFHS